ncbi:MAG: diversity-generating retroelement protein bAvd family protein [Bacteroidetes bacterium HGW-Bacteroidetes-17]|jgi:four helix bundle protein|nr:MAG: diversity-generating retroelement protein bAvd family protein [Bacteroidetes bacterium HGW-Bacteroidetes-17]
MHNFLELKVWQKSRELVKKIYQSTVDFPTNEKLILESQIKRSAISISSNIAEGAGRETSKEFSRFLDIASGSAFELESQIILALDLEFINLKDGETLINEIKEIQKMINGFKASLNKS